MRHLCHQRDMGVDPHAAKVKSLRNDPADAGGQVSAGSLALVCVPVVEAGTLSEDFFVHY